MPECVARESKVNAIIKNLNDWREGPRPPSPEEFERTVDLLIERLQELQIGDNDWSETA